MKTLEYHITQVTTVREHLYQVLLSARDSAQFNYQAGQYLQILLPEWEPRPFSIANAPNEKHNIELHIQHYTDNDYTQKLIAHITEHSTLKLNGPYGKCIYQPIHQYPIILLAGGTGFAPIKAIIEQAFIEDDQRPLHLFWGAKTLDDLYCHGLATSWQQRHNNFAYTPVLEESSPNWKGQLGRVHQAVVKTYPDLRHVQIYAAGPFAMITTALELFEQHSFNRVNMHSDALETDYV